MYRNFTPNDNEHRTEDNPRTPTNIPEDLEDRCHRIFEHVETWSNKGAVKYVYPKTEEGYNDYALMLDLMEIESGDVVDFRDKRLFVIERLDVWVKWGERYRVERGGVKMYHADDERYIKFTPSEDGYSPKGLWKAYIYGEIENVGNISVM